MKKYLGIMIVSMIGFLGGNIVFAQSVTFDDIKDEPYKARGDLQEGEDAVNLGEVIKDDAVEPGDSVAERIQQFLGVDYGSEQRATFFIKNMVNWFLAIVGMVALIILLYGFYQMFTNGDNEERLKHARKVVIGAAIALAVIGLSWFLVSLLFDIFEQTRDAV